MGARPCRRVVAHGPQRPVPSGHPHVQKEEVLSLARTHAPHLARTARLSAVTGLGAAVLVSAFALPAMAEPVDAVQRGPAKIVAVKKNQQRKTVAVKQGDNLSKLAKQAKL